MESHPEEQHVGSGPVAEREPAAHCVQFYESDFFLCQVIARFAGVGLASGERVVLLATREHWSAVSLLLKGNAFDPRRAIDSGRLSYRDAHETLRRIMVNGAPDPESFQQIIGEILRPNGERVRVYGEMVDLLWKDNRLPAALRLEDLWRRVVEETGVSLLCGYAMARPGGGAWISNACATRFYARLSAGDRRGPGCPRHASTRARSPPAESARARERD